MIPVCFNIPSNCDSCYEKSIDYCPPSINIQAKLTPGATLYLWIRDKFQHTWGDLITVDLDGSFDINQNNFPKGMFTPSFGSLDIFLTTDDLGQNIVPLNFGMDEYNCILLSVNSAA